MQAGRSVGFGLRARQALFDRLILGKLRAQIGLDQARFAVSAAAPINPELIRFVRAIGIEMIEAYGMTETTAPIAVNPIGGSRIGTVGPPIPGVEVRTAPDGEILVRGPNVFAGYLKNEDATRDTISEDGWLRTGDVGSIDEAGYVVVTDRKKDLIITAGGKNIAPQVIEERLKFHPLISQAVVIGDRRPYLAALLTPDVEAMAAWARENGIGFSVPAELVANDIVLAEVRRGVEEVNKLVSSVEQVKRWTLLDHDFLQEADELTPTIKVKRANVNKRYADAIEGLYG
jgi:long-chain acyl-CoA synthetase